MFTKHPEVNPSYHGFWHSTLTLLCLFYRSVTRRSNEFSTKWTISSDCRFALLNRSSTSFAQLHHSKFLLIQRSTDQLPFQRTGGSSLAKHAKCISATLARARQPAASEQSINPAKMSK